MKTRFAKASLRARCARHRSWGATCLFPNHPVGHSATQSSRWTLSYPVHETDRRATFLVVQNTHPLQAASQLQMLYFSTSTNLAIFVAQIQLSSRPRRSTGLAPASAIPLLGRSMQLWVSPRPPSSTIVLDAISSSRVRHSPRHPSRSAASFLVVLHALRLATSNNRAHFMVPIHHSRRQDRIHSSSL